MSGMLDVLNLHGRTAVVVGGAGHLGAVIAQGLSTLGAGVALVDRDESGMHRASDVIRRAGGADVSMHLADLEDFSAADVRRDVLQRHPGVDILVHAAALVGTSPLSGWNTSFAEQSVDTWRRGLEVNLTSAFTVVQALAPDLAAGGHGAVVLVGSIYGHLGVDMSLYSGTGMGSPVAYAASKGGLSQFMRWAATVLAPEVRVNMVSPGGIQRGQDPLFVTEYVRRTPLKRMAAEQDVAHAVCFLCSDASAYVTGQDLLVDGGWSAW